MHNRLGIKADGEAMDVERMTRREIADFDREMFEAYASAARQQEQAIEKELKRLLKRFPIYNEWLSTVNGVGPIAAGWIIGEMDINIATTVSKMWAFCGLNPSMVPGKKRIQLDNGEYDIVPSGDMVRGDRLTEGHVSPFNRKLRIALIGVMASSFIKAQNDYAMSYYYPYKARLEQEDSIVSEVPSRGKPAKDIAWKDAKKAHRDRAAQRYMVKMFLRDLYVQWRTIAGLPVREPYQQEYLGHTHAA